MENEIDKWTEKTMDIDNDRSIDRWTDREMYQKTNEMTGKYIDEERSYTGKDIAIHTKTVKWFEGETVSGSDK